MATIAITSIPDFLVRTSMPVHEHSMPGNVAVTPGMGLMRCRAIGISFARDGDDGGVGNRRVETKRRLESIEHARCRQARQVLDALRFTVAGLRLTPGRESAT